MHPGNQIPYVLPTHFIILANIQGSTLATRKENLDTQHTYAFKYAPQNEIMAIILRSKTEGENMET